VSPGVIAMFGALGVLAGLTLRPIVFALFRADRTFAARDRFPLPGPGSAC
jgi:hypothetical protein